MEYYLTLKDGKLERHKTDCPLTLETMQAAVGGLIERASMFVSAEGGHRTIDVWVNEEGLCLGMPFTCYLAGLSRDPMSIVGPVLICAGDAEGDCVGLTEKEVDQIAHGGVVLAVLEPNWMPEGADIGLTRNVLEAARASCRRSGPNPPEEES